MRRRKQIMAIGLIIMMLAGVLAGTLTVFAQEAPGTEETQPQEAGPPETPDGQPSETPDGQPPEAPEGTELPGAEAQDAPDAADSAASGTADGDGTGTATEETPASAASGETLPEETVITLVGKYDSADTAPVVRVDESRRTVTLRNHDIGRNYTLSYDETTRFLDLFGRETGISQITPGMLVDVTFLKSSKHLNSLQPSFGGRVFTYENLREYKLPAKISVDTNTESMASIGGSKYLLDLRTLILVNGVESSVSSILEGDEITVVGADREIYAVTVTRGHGYLSLSSDTVNGSSLVGAWIELDHSVIRKISPQMLMTAPEGEYTLYIVGNGADYSAPVTITRGRETVVDTSVIPIEPPKTGNIRFEIMPSSAEVKVDGNVVDKQAEIPLEYGIHTLEISAEGYTPLMRYLRVGSARAVVRLTLEREQTSQTDTESSSTGATGGSSTDTSGETGGNTVSEVSLSTGTETSDSATTDTGTGATGTGATADTSASEATGSASGGSQTETQTGDTAQTGNSSQTGAATQDHTDTGQPGNTGGQETQGGNTTTQQPGPQPQPEPSVQAGKIYVDEPAGALMFLDGNYIGYIPGSFDKTGGIHTVTLQRPGYHTISYNIELDESPVDRTFRFPELVKEGEPDV